MKNLLIFIIVCTICLLVIGCYGDFHLTKTEEDGGTGSDSDAQNDIDIDTNSDIDTNTDSDIDADTDSNTDTTTDNLRKTVVGVSSGGGVARSSNYRCFLTMGGSATATATGMEYEAKIGIGAISSKR